MIYIKGAIWPLFLDLIYNEVDEFHKKSKIITTLCELLNIINSAHLIIGQSIEKKENRGGYFNSDNLN